VSGCGAVLVLRDLGLGDALTGVAALRGLRRRFPGSELLLAGPPEPGRWLVGHGVVDDVVPADRLPRGLIAVNLHGSGPQSHRRLAAAAPSRLIAFAHPEFPAGPCWDPHEHEVTRWTRLVGHGTPADLRLATGSVRREDVVVVHPGAASGSRRWPVERWRAVVAGLRETGTPVAVTGGPAETELGAAVAAGLGVTDLTGRLTLAALAARVASARVLLCGDTGVAHLATALATPSVLLFGPTPPSRWGPAIDPHLHTVIWHGDEATPGDPHADRPDPALLRITPDEILAAAADLDGSGRGHAAEPGDRPLQPVLPVDLGRPAEQLLGERGVRPPDLRVVDRPVDELQP
jgi:ADP-heptose:LPS heptosyltransferase